MEELVHFELTREFVERFQKALDERDNAFIVESLVNVKAADISALLYEFNSDESKYVLDLLPLETQAEIINDLDTDTRVNFIKVYQSFELISMFITSIF